MTYKIICEIEHNITLEKMLIAAIHSTLATFYSRVAPFDQVALPPHGSGLEPLMAAISKAVAKEKRTRKMAWMDELGSADMIDQMNVQDFAEEADRKAAMVVRRHMEAKRAYDNIFDGVSGASVPRVTSDGDLPF